MPKYVLIGQKVLEGTVKKDEIIGYYTDPLTLYCDMEDCSKEYNKFFIGREERPQKLQPISDKELDRLQKDLMKGE